MKADTFPTKEKAAPKIEKFMGGLPDPAPRQDENPKLKPGDVVQLKSGGPVMTVVRVDEEDPMIVMTRWFDKSDNHWQDSFLVDCLNKKG